MKFFVKTDDTCVLEVSGQNLLAALENSVSTWPTEDSRFCQVSPTFICYGSTWNNGVLSLCVRLPGLRGEQLCLDHILPPGKVRILRL